MVKLIFRWKLLIPLFFLVFALWWLGHYMIDSNFCETEYRHLTNWSDVGFYMKKVGETEYCCVSEPWYDRDARFIFSKGRYVYLSNCEEVK